MCQGALQNPIQWSHRSRISTPCPKPWHRQASSMFTVAGGLSATASLHYILASSIRLSKSEEESGNVRRWTGNEMGEGRALREEGMGGGGGF